MTALNLLATKRSSFKSGSWYIFTDLSRSLFVPFQLIGAIFYLAIPEMYVESGTVANHEDQHDVRGGIAKRRRALWLNAILGLPWLRGIDNEKQKHGLVLILAKRLISKEDWSCYLMDSSSSPASPVNPLIQATILGNNEMIKEILKTCPESSDSLDENGRNILHISVQQKNLHLYEYLKKNLAYKDRMLAEVDKNWNNIVHLASNVSTTRFGGVTDFPTLEIAGQMS